MYARKIGILGGGQLGRMLVQAGYNFDVEIHVLEKTVMAPCANVTRYFHEGNILDQDDVLAFGRRLDVITIEIENVNTEALYLLEENKVGVWPQPAIIDLIKNKARQKKFFSENNIPTAEYHTFANLAEVKQALAGQKIQFPFIQKIAVGGYDGRGVKKISDKKGLESAFDAENVVEEFIDIAHETSVIVARNHQQEIQTYEPVELFFKPGDHVLDHLLAPCTLADTEKEKMKSIAALLAESFNLVGLLAVEFIVSTDGRILVNEVSPRPHNSGHHTIEANITSQYEQHLRAIMGLPLGSTAARNTASKAAMVNLLGETGYNGPAKIEGLATVMGLEGLHFHWYGKKETKPGRKMGHVTLVDNDLDRLNENLQLVKEKLKVVS